MRIRQILAIFWCIFLSVSGRSHPEIKNSNKEIETNLNKNSEDNTQAETFTLLITIPIQENGMFGIGEQSNNGGKSKSNFDVFVPQEEMRWKNNLEHQKGIFTGNVNNGRVILHKNLGGVVDLKSGQVVYISNNHGGFGVHANHAGAYRLINGNRYFGDKNKENHEFMLGFNNNNKIINNNPVHGIFVRSFDRTSRNQKEGFGNEVNFIDSKRNARDPEEFNENANNRFKEGFLNPAFLVNNNHNFHNFHNFQKNENRFPGFFHKNTDEEFERKEIFPRHVDGIGGIFQKNGKDAFSSLNYSGNDFDKNSDEFKANNEWMGVKYPRVNSNVRDVRWFYQGNNQNGFKNYATAGNMIDDRFLLRNGNRDNFGSHFTATNKYEKKVERNEEQDQRLVDLKYKQLNRVPEHKVSEFARSTKEVSRDFVRGVQYDDDYLDDEIRHSHAGQEYSDEEESALKLGSSPHVTFARKPEADNKKGAGKLGLKNSAAKETYSHAGDAFIKSSNISEEKNKN